MKVRPYENCKLLSGVLCKAVDGQDVFIVPHRIEKEIISKAHENDHFSASKCKEIIQNCVKCILLNKKQKKKKKKIGGFLECIDKANGRNFQLQIHFYSCG